MFLQEDFLNGVFIKRGLVNLADGYLKKDTTEAVSYTHLIAMKNDKNQYVFVVADKNGNPAVTSNGKVQLMDLSLIHI